MKALIFTLFLCFSFTILFCQPTLMPAHTKAAIQVIRNDLAQNRNNPSRKILDFYPIYQHHDQKMIALLGRINSDFNKDHAVRDGFDVGAVIGKVVSMRIPLSRFNEDFYYPGIEYIEVAEKIEPFLDGAVRDIRADLVHQGFGLPQSYTGKGVLIGIADWGFDYTHPTFYDTALTYNRIRAAWDQEKKVGTPPEGFSHGVVYLDTMELRLAQSDTLSNTSDYHGTHVAGIAGGSGAGTVYRGVGFESDLLFSQMRRDASSSIDAFQWMYNMAQQDGKRLVINNSWGGYRNNPLDGTSLVSQAIEAFTDLGVVIVFSGANNGNINFHLKKTFDHDTVKTRIMGFNYAGDSDLWGQTVNMWGEPGHPFTAQFRVLDETNELIGQSDYVPTQTAPAYIDTFMIIGPDTIFYNFTTDAAHPLNDRPQMTLNVKCTNTDLRCIIYAEAESGTVHFWNSRLTIYGGGNWGFGFTAPTAGYVLGDRNYGVGHPGITSSAITVAAHVTDGGITSFSSYGPRMDDFMKPDISAPGQNISSALSSFADNVFIPSATVMFNGKEYDFFRISGTSMSAPMVSGAVSLLLEADPSLSPDEIKDILLDNTRLDGQTGMIGPEGHVRWGRGKLDVYNVISSIATVSVFDNIGFQPVIYPNPAGIWIKVDGLREASTYFYEILGIDGKSIIHGVYNGSIDVSSLNSGLYALKMTGSNESFTAKVLIGF